MIIKKCETGASSNLGFILKHIINFAEVHIIATNHYRLIFGFPVLYHHPPELSIIID
jgi:hypothetical protein